MPAKKKAAAPAVETRSFEEIIASRLPKTPNTRERLQAAAAARAEARAKVAAQAQEPARAKRRERNERILAKHKGRRTSDYYREVAAANSRGR